MSTQQQQFETVSAGLETQRGLLGDAVVDAALAPLREGNDALALVRAQSALDAAVSVGNPPLESMGWCALANAELALGREAAATTAFENAHRVALALERDGLAVASSMRLEAQAGLARAALAQGDLPRAMHHVEPLLVQLADAGALCNAEAPFLVKLICYQMLERARDPRAAEMLATAHRDLQAKAAALSDAALRDSFLNRIPEHRAIVAAWVAAQARRST